ncbi:tail protein X [Croceicoccus sp. BE223]|uniref:tail protein X n=1 Tax=Croceicoccus sp. BE223 TaxID=2817716 RepID=UPI0028556E58|nr:tail protein X [Croceicoccus sp. BE223]MDR7101473.1 phage tail protein X [Croceicoccus sp. BE223]
MPTVQARQGDTLDLICWRELGTTAGITEATFELNRGLADAGPVLPEGAIVTLPEPAASPIAARETLKLWE